MDSPNVDIGVTVDTQGRRVKASRTLWYWLVEERPRRLDVLVLAISLALHAILAIGYVLWRPVNVAPTPPLNRNQEKLLAFRLVETPESARQEKPPAEATALSDKNAHAQNPEAPDEIPNGEPYASLRTDMMSEGGLEGVEAGLSAPTTNPTAGAARAEPSLSQSIDSREQGESGALPILQDRSRPKFTREVLGPTSDDLMLPRAGGGRQDSKARFLGDFSLNTYAWDYAPYILQMKRKIASNLYPPPAFTRLGIISGKVVLRFKVMANGEVRDLEVESYDCHPSLVETSVQAVRNSSAFRPLPKDFPEPYLELRWTFLYIVYGVEEQ